MKYDFDRIIDRRGTDCEKWDGVKADLPMWVADMDFEAAPCIREALQKRLDHGVFGYSYVPDEWYDAYIHWWEKRHGYRIEKDWLIFCTGVIPAISSIVRKLTTPNENVVILSPVYNIFYNSIINNGARVLECELKENAAGAGYGIDFDDLERKLSDPQTSLMIFCNPHNPVGKIWDKETLARVGELAYKYHVTVISDEIHCDIVKPGCGYVPFPSASEHCAEICIQCIAPTKAFNIAGLHTAAVCVQDSFLRHKVWRALNTDEVAEPNAFAVTAAIAAFEHGEEWLDGLCDYVFENRRIAAEFIRSGIEGIRVVDGDATYLMWLDVLGICADGRRFNAYLQRHEGLMLSDGCIYGKGGEKFLRLNVACPRSRLMDGLERLKRGAAAMLNEKNVK